MAKKSNPVKRVQRSYLSHIRQLSRENKSFSAMLRMVRDSKDSSIFQKSRLESKVYDETWIKNLERGFASLDRIILNPRTFIKEKREVVLAGQAKKVNSESVQHLASHTELIHSVDENGKVQPERILTISTEEDYQTYENRFVMTLINKLVFFIEKRYNFIKDHGETRDSDLLLLHNVAVIEGLTYEYDARIKVSKPSNDNGNVEKNIELLAKIKRLRERAAYYLNCNFMQQMNGAKPVHNPLSMTNLLLKNPDYHKAYELWKFIDAYTKLGVTYNIKETNQKFDKAYFDDVYALSLGSMMTLSSHLVDQDKVDSTYKSKRKKIVPKVLLNLDDETFLDSKFIYQQFGSKASGTGYGVGEGRKLGEAPLQGDQIAELRKKEEARQKADLLKKKKIEEMAEAKRKRLLAKEAAEQAAKERKERQRLAAIEAKRLAEERRAEALRKKKEEADRKKALEEARIRELSLLEKARRHVRSEARKDKAADNAADEQAKPTPNNDGEKA